MRYWKLFTDENNNTGPFYDYTFIEQLLGRRDSFFVENCSFIVLFEDIPISITPLFLENSNNIKSFSYILGFNTVYAPLISKELSNKLRKRVRNMSFNHIDKLAHNNKVLKANMTIDPFCYFTEKEYYNWLLEYGYIDFSITTSIIDLCTEEKDLKKNFRTSYKALINKGLRTYDICIYDSGNITYKVFKEYEKMHEKAAGRTTRNKTSFEIQYDKIKKSKATLTVAMYKNQFVQIIYFDHLNGYVYYSSSAADPYFNQSNVPISYALIWSSIIYFKKMKNQYFEMGWQHNAKQLFQNNNQKDIDISFFKSGFGGFNMPLFRGIKYYDKNTMKNELIDSINDYLL